MVLCVSSFSVSLCSVFTFCVSKLYIVRFRFLSDQLFEKSCSFDLPYIFFELCLFVGLVVSHFDFEGGTLVLIASFPDYCIPFTFFSQ